MKLVLEDQKELTEGISVISQLTYEVNMKATENNLEIVAMDPTNVSMVIFKMKKEAFVEYTAKDENIGINLNDLKGFLKRIKGKVTIETKDNKIRIEGENPKKTFIMLLIDIEKREQKVPELAFPIEINLSTSIMNEILKDADIVAESLSFGVSGNELEITADGDLMKMNQKIQIESRAENPMKAKYSLEYLKKMIANSFEKTKIRFNTDYPLKIDYKNDKVELGFILAPRVEK